MIQEKADAGRHGLFPETDSFGVAGDGHGVISCRYQNFPEVMWKSTEPPECFNQIAKRMFLSA